MDDFKNRIRDAKSAADELAEEVPKLANRGTFDAAFERTTELITRVRDLVSVPIPEELGPEEREMRSSMLDLIRRMNGQMVAIERSGFMVEQDRAFPEMVGDLRKQLDTLLLKANEVDGGRRRRKTRRAKRKSMRTKRIYRHYRKTR